MAVNISIEFAKKCLVQMPNWRSIGGRFGSMVCIARTMLLDVVLTACGVFSKAEQDPDVLCSADQWTPFGNPVASDCEVATLSRLKERELNI